MRTIAILAAVFLAFATSARADAPLLSYLPPGHIAESSMPMPRGWDEARVIREVADGSPANVSATARSLAHDRAVDMARELAAAGSPMSDAALRDLRDAFLRQYKEWLHIFTTTAEYRRKNEGDAADRAERALK